MTRRKYSDVEKAEAIATVKSNGGNIFRTSQELGIPWATLADWVKGAHGINHGVTELREEKEKALADLCEQVARKYLNHAGDAYVIAAVPGNLAMTAAGIAIDKSQLLRGKPTEITESTDVTRSLEASIQQATLRDRLSPENAAIGLYEALKTDPQFSDVKSWPAEYQPIIQAHLQEVEGVQ